MTSRLQNTLRASRLFTTAIGATAFAVFVAGPSHADEAAAPAAGDASTLRVCAAEKELPYSASDKSGFENKIAEALADAMGRKAVFVWSEKPAIYAVRDQLDKKLCDVVVGVDTGDERVLTSRAYYRAPYVFVQRKDSPLDIKTWDSPDLAKAAPIGFVRGSPAEVMITKHDLYNDSINYVSSLTNFKDKRNSYTRIPPDRMVAEVADKTAGAAAAFAPEVARYVKGNPDLKMTVIPDDNVRSDGEPVPHHFDQSFAVRKDDKTLLSAIDAALPKAKEKIEAILKEEGIPYVAPAPRT